MTARDIALLISAGRYRLGHEALLQEDIEARLLAEGVPFTREHILGPADRVDFLVDGRIAVELKIKANKRRIMRQIERYAAHDCVDSVVLVTATATGMAPMLNGKPVYVVNLGRTCL